VIATNTLMLFAFTTFVVVLSPGPAAIAVTSEAIMHGYKRSAWLILGIAVANAVFFVLSATGIATLILSSSLLFSMIKWVGVAYLLYLGLHAMFSKSGPIQLKTTAVGSANILAIFVRGFTLEIANPKALIYFSALLPQFIDVASPIIPQLLTYCVITFVLDLSCYSLYAYFGSRTAILKKSPAAIKMVNRIAGSMLVFVSMRMASLER
jgi:homoserine/homoserine lactone efflux protein